MTNKEHALQYLGRGLCVIPACSPLVSGHGAKCGKSLGKHPLLKEWTTYQKRKPTIEEVEKWWTDWPEANIIIVCGAVSNNLVVVDIDDPEGYEAWVKKSQFILDLEATWNYMTGGGGLHAHFRTSFPANKRKFPWGEIQGEGTYVIAPPSLHQSGTRYEPPLTDDIRIIAAPPPLEALLRDHSLPQEVRDSRDYVEELIGGLQSLSKGERTDKLVAYGGRLAGKNLDAKEINFILGMANEMSDEPLTDQEFESQVATAGRRFGQRRMEELRKLQEYTPDEDDSAGEIPTFPREVMTGILGFIVKEYDKIREGASEFYFCSMAQQLLTASGRTIEFETASGEIIDRKPKFFMVIAAPTGHHKSTTVDDMSFIVKILTRNVGYIVKAGARGSGEGLDNKLKERKTMIVCYDEFKLLLQKKRMEGNTLVNELTRLFEEDTIEGMTVKDTEQILDVFLNFTGLVTIKDLKRVITSDLDEGGFLNRIFFVVGRDKAIKPNKVKLPEESKKHIQEKLCQMFMKYGTALEITPVQPGVAQAQVQVAHTQPNPAGKQITNTNTTQAHPVIRCTIKRSAEAEKIFTEWYTKLRKSDEDMSYGIRLDNYYNAWEIAITMSKMEEVVTKETALDVVKIMDYELTVRKWIWSHIQEGSYNEWAYRIMEKVRETPGIGKGKIRYLLHGDRNPSAFNAGMDSALKSGMIEKMLNDEGKEVFVPGGIE